MIGFDASRATVSISDVVIDASGREERRLTTIRADGHEHASETGNGYTLMATWRGENVLETVARRDGEVVGSGTYEVSADGETLSVSGDQLLIVFDRVTDPVGAG
jgi:hypothetical protein